MLITKYVNIRISNRNIKYYKDYGKIGDNININVNKLLPNSVTKIVVKCDNCGEEKTIQYRNFLKNMNNYNLYYCNKCGIKKISDNT